MSLYVYPQCDEPGCDTGRGRIGDGYAITPDCPDIKGVRAELAGNGWTRIKPYKGRPAGDRCPGCTSARADGNGGAG